MNLESTPTQTHVWIAIRVVDQIKDYGEHCGKISSFTLDQIIEGSYHQPLFELTDVFWRDESKFIFMEKYSWGYGTTWYLLTNNILRITRLREDYIARMQIEKANYLNSEEPNQTLQPKTHSAWRALFAQLLRKPEARQKK
jgi:hypothetical protein